MQTVALLVLAVWFGCAVEPAQNNGTVPVNLSLVINQQHAQDRSFPSRVLAFLQQWLPGGAASVWAQSVSDIVTVRVQVLGPDLPDPPTTTVSVSNPAPGDIIPVTIQAPVGPSRTIVVAALNAAGQEIFGGSANVNLVAGGPVNLEITLVRLFTVTVQKQGAGSGTVTSSPAGINCGPTCAEQFEEGTSVSLIATAAPGSVFGGWSGACSGTGACTITGGDTVVATFNAAANTASLAVTKSGTGSGTVSSNPNGINCGNICSANFEAGSTVVLTAGPAGNSTFAGWSGGGCSGTVSCVVVMNGNQSVTATFNAPVPPSTATLSVTIAGDGKGKVTSAPAGIDCNSGTCSAVFPGGTVVTLTADPTGNSTFAGWSRAECSVSGTCTVPINGDQAVVATFTASGSTGLPNLVIQSITLVPASPIAGQIVLFTGVVQNVGTGATPWNGDINAQGIGISFRIDDATIGPCHLSPGPLPPGGTMPLTGDSCTPYMATDGPHTVVGFVDDVGRIEESNEGDNQLSLSFTVGPPPSQ